MSEQTIEITDADAGTRVDKLVARATGLGRAAVKRLFDEGRVRLGRRRLDKGASLAAGARVTVELGERLDEAAQPDDSPLTLLLLRDDVIVVDKPPRRPTAPLRAGELGTIANALVGRFPELASHGHNPREPGLVHRLDNDTSGVLVAARTRTAWDELVEAMREGRLHQRYLALVEDDELPDAGVVDVPLAPHPKDQRRVLACLHPRDVAREKPRAARTEYRVLARGAGVALVEAEAPRALRHQVRAHLAVLRCPILGDTLYGASAREGLDRHALHASRVAYDGGPAVAPFVVESPLPEDLASIARASGVPLSN
ncbi:MAG: RluA family pseudouridine synthase [Polyangiaceae bacterium]|nr:RluA family pseudouridine synthase [Polyangiaceae bacterium]